MSLLLLFIYLFCAESCLEDTTFKRFSLTARGVWIGEKGAPLLIQVGVSVSAPLFMGAGDRGAPSAPLFPLIAHSPEGVEQVNISR